MKVRRKFLIMEKQDNLRELMSFFIESKFNFEAVKCTNILTASELIKDKDIVLVLCGNGYFYDDHRALEELYNREYSSGKMKYCDIGVLKKKIKKEDQGAFSKGPFKDVIDTIGESFVIVPNENVQEYTPVSLDSLPYFHGIDSDLYIQLPSERFVKLFREGDVVDMRDVKKYQSKNVKYLYLNQACYSWMLRVIEEDIYDICSDPNYIVTQDFDTLRAEMGIEKEVYEELIDRATDIKNLITKNNNLKAFLSNMVLDRKIEQFFNNRIKLISMISCGLAKELSWGSEESYRKLILAAHLHDIHIMSNPALAMIKTEDSFLKMRHMFSGDDYKLLTTHPEMTARMLERDPAIPDEVISIISQHHEISDGSGFPNKADHKRIKPYSCLFIVSLDLATYILGNKNWKLADFISKNKDNYRGVTFRKILRQLAMMKGVKAPQNSLAKEH